MIIIIIIASVLIGGAAAFAFLYKPKCPACGVGRLKSEGYNTLIDKLIYKCTKCGRQFI